MANTEMLMIGPISQTRYFHLRQQGSRWNGSAMEAYNASHWGNYSLSAADSSTVGEYTAITPVALPAGMYDVLGYIQSGASPDPSDAPPIAYYTSYWSGSTWPTTSIIVGGIYTAATNVPAVVSGSTLTLVRGDDYFNADGRAIAFTCAGPSITGASISLS